MHSYTTLSDTERKKIVRALQGTSYTIDEALADIFPLKQLEELDLHPDSLAEINLEIFWCDECANWLPKKKQSDFEYLCTGCSTQSWD